MALSYRIRIFLIQVLFVSIIDQVLPDRTSLKIYQPIQAEFYCFRRLNGTHEFGCSSERSGNVGVIHVVSTEEDVQFILDDDSGVKYIAALRSDFFNMGNMTKLQDSGRVTGVIVLRSRQDLPEEGFSPDSTCPNDGFGLYSDHNQYSGCKKVSWNAKNPGTDMFFTRWNFPIFLVDNETSIDIIVNKCFNSYNLPTKGTHERKWPLCAAQLRSRMSAAKDSVTCIRRSENLVTMNPLRYCDPLTDRNVISTLYPTSNEKPVSDRSVVVVGARLDTFSMFDGLAPGAHSSVSSFVTLLIAAQMLNQLKVAQKPEFVKNNVLFVLFNGEAFDYIGSSRIVYDMEKGQFPLVNQSGSAKVQPANLALKHISHFVELSQVAPLGESSTIYLHTDPVSTGSAEVNQTVKDLVEQIKRAAEAQPLELTVEASPHEQPLPPSSVQRFLKKDKNIASVVITNHNKQFLNRYYNSYLDTWENLNSTGWDLQAVAKQLTKLAAAVASAVFKVITGEDAKGLALDKFRTVELLECYVLNASCALFGEVTNKASVSAMRSKPFPLYVSVDPNGRTINPSTVLTRLVMAYLTGEHLKKVTKENCSSLADSDKLQQYIWMDGPDTNETGLCVRSTTMMTLARSPAHELKDWSTREYSTWTESVWEEASLQVFLMPSFRQEVSVLIGGIAVFLVSLLTVHCLNQKALVLFTPRALVGI
ncbi:nicastrin [Dermacentor andersoni]|uniref:nicastrin n=1 Tax=Dermacentor andersoni TaxID=34620 RepID=UPI002155C633|nr:nicastrin-like [Dermacentor andersoni]